MKTKFIVEERISKQELQKMYGFSRYTIEDWVKNQGSPMIQLFPYKRFVRKSNLIEWVESLRIQKH
tara:strand:- start:288 stop:485 length:198 start_codon:yes stop_codon:yes gene_type:complete